MARIAPIWIEAAVACAVHDRQLAEHGGPAGIRDTAMLESALARPRDLWSYDEDDLCTLAAAYAGGVTRNHPFIDGNKRAAWVLARVFLQLNGIAIRFAPEDAVRMMWALAAGVQDEAKLAEWFRRHVQPA